MFYTNTEKSFDELNKDTSNKITPQLKVGDKVKILPKNIFPANYFPTYAYTDGMLKYAKRLATITSLNLSGCKIDLDDGIYLWPYKALQLITSETDETVDLYKLKNGDYIKIINTKLSDRSYIYLFKEMINKKIFKHASYHLESKTIDVNPNRRWLLGAYTKITYATEEEKKLLDNALLEQGYKWNNSTKQLDSIGVIDSCTNNFMVSPFSDSILRVSNMFTDILSYRQEEPQIETELNLFPTKKHYQLNFNY